MRNHKNGIGTSGLIIKTFLSAVICLGASSCTTIVYEIPETGEPKEYLSVFVGGKKTGYYEMSRTIEFDRVITEMKEVAWYDRFLRGLGERIGYTKHIESYNGEPIAFEYIENRSIESLFFCAKKSTKIEGVKTEDGKLRITKSRNGKTKNFEMEWPEDLLLSEGMRLSYGGSNLKEGETFSAREIFEYNPIRVFEYRARVGKTKRVSYFGGADTLTEIFLKGDLPRYGEIFMVVYVDKELNMKRIIVRLGGFELEAISCSREIALSKTDLVDSQLGPVQFGR